MNVKKKSTAGLKNLYWEEKWKNKIELKYLQSYIHDFVLGKAKQPLIQYYAEAMCKGSIRYKIDTYLMTARKQVHSPFAGLSMRVTHSFQV